MATVKVSEETYAELNRIAGRMRADLNRPVSIDEALETVLEKGRLKPSDFAGAFIMSDREEKEISESLRRSWSRWRSQSE